MHLIFSFTDAPSIALDGTSYYPGPGIFGFLIASILSPFPILFIYLLSYLEFKYLFIKLFRI